MAFFSTFRRVGSAARITADSDEFRDFERKYKKAPQTLLVTANEKDQKAPVQVKNVVFEWNGSIDEFASGQKQSAGIQRDAHGHFQDLDPETKVGISDLSKCVLISVEATHVFSDMPIPIGINVEDLPGGIVHHETGQTHSLIVPPGTNQYVSMPLFETENVELTELKSRMLNVTPAMIDQSIADAGRIYEKTTDREGKLRTITKLCIDRNSLLGTAVLANKSEYNAEMRAEFGDDYEPNLDCQQVVVCEQSKLQSYADFLKVRLATTSIKTVDLFQLKCQMNPTKDKWENANTDPRIGNPAIAESAVLENAKVRTVLATFKIRFHLPEHIDLSTKK